MICPPVEKCVEIRILPAGHDVDRDLGDGVCVQAERGSALGHHAADEVVTHREHDVRERVYNFIRGLF